jgi:hypothetical protein
MMHPDEEALVDAFYEGPADELKMHLDACPDCECLYRSICETLAAATQAETQASVPERGPGYGAEVWARVLPRLPLVKTKAMWSRWWLFAPASAALLAMVFAAGMLTEHKRTIATLPDRTSERVLYLTLSEHLDQAQVMLTELAHAAAPDQRQRARDLITQNRILRQRTLHAGDTRDAALLDDLERVLVEAANSDAQSEAMLRQRMEDGNLLFRVRISSSDARLKGEKL